MSNNRTVIVGGPRTGKTTLAVSLHRPNHEMPVYHTDDLVEAYEWSEASERCADWYEDAGPWVVEGTVAVRGLRKFLGRNIGIKPCDSVIYLTGPYEPLTYGQANITNGIATIFNEIKESLIELGIEIDERSREDPV